MAEYEPVGSLKFNRISHNMQIAIRDIDVDRQTGASSDGQIDANDVLNAIPVKAGETVLLAWVEVMTACTGAASYDLGVGEDVDCWVDGAALDGVVIETGTTAAITKPHRFSTADTIDCIVLEQNVTAGRFRVCALIVQI